MLNEVKSITLNHNKERVILMRKILCVLLGLLLTCSLVTSAFAVESMPLEDAQLDAGYENIAKSNSMIAPMMNDTIIIVALV